MKVLFFSDNCSDHNRRFLDKLAENGLELWFLNPTTGDLPQGWLPNRVQWIRTKQKLRPEAEPSEFARFLPEFLDCLKHVRPDLVHAGPTHDAGYVTALSGFHPWLLMSWGSDILYQTGQGERWKQATQQALSGADGFFCDCNAVRTKAREFANLPDERIVQLPWGIRKGLFAPTGARPAASDFVREPGTRIVICTRSWEPLYGIDVLLDAFRRAHGADSLLRLLLLGKGSTESHVRRFIGDAGLERAVSIPGIVARPEMPNWFRVADIYVSCTKSDGTSVSLLEAMATGLPVVVSDLPANREWVIEGQNGWLARSDSAEEFGDRLLRAARLNREQRNSMSDRNQRVVAERADWDRNFPRLLEMYERLTAMQIAR